MTEKTLYTAIGRIVKQKESAPMPAVLLGGKEYYMDLQEFLIWSSLHWRIARRDEIRKLYNRFRSTQSLPTSRTLDECIVRLLIRGLLICGSGETEYDAIYDLLSPLYIVPLTISPVLRFLTACKMRIQHKSRVSPIKQLFWKDKRTPAEQTVMNLSNQAILSTAEVIRCVEMDVQQLPNADSVMDAIYGDRETTSDNIGALVKSALCAQEITMAVANLYVRQQMIFDRV